MDLTALMAIATGYLVRAHRTLRDRSGRLDDDGASTLELVIIILGLILLAAALVAALTLAVNRRLAQIN
ncbi:MAG TPA: hypothetical protein VGK17_06890 [Propionicimonas sp.]|jgi:hypothetical protein